MGRSDTLSEDQIRWVWAYRQLITLLDRFDGEGLDCAKRCEVSWGVDPWGRFLNTYGLKRGLHANLRHKSDEIFERTVPVFKQLIGEVDAVSELTKRWTEGVKIIGSLVDKKKKDGTDPELWSMASKILWFYQPESMTMYDAYAAKALEAESNRRLLHVDFLSVHLGTS